MKKETLRMQKLAGILNESQYEAKKQMLNEEVIDFTNQEQFYIEQSSKTTFKIKQEN